MGDEEIYRGDEDIQRLRYGDKGRFMKVRRLISHSLKAVVDKRSCKEMP